ncbi:MAG: hypothetical protein HY744_04235 [Deltaproteobacteria bacterium]|nr:hypothetical protein [Deltaproteobacteria bacterium]
MSLLRDDPFALPCPSCLEIDGLSLRFDRRQRPFTICSSCGTRTFLRGRASMLGLAMLGDVIRELAAAVQTDAAAAEQMRQRTAAFFAGLEQRFAPPAPARSDLGTAVEPAREVAA